ncbi:uncharacterized protein C5orf49 homolog [Tachysurus fulvidraco]|uniref:uncharacterized protein C5orf49 homolog n=1 Tax=Tachysurus fulvidraco TaxID=1234273 RepID=UPI000F5167E3|nr:uncharacterized protein C5orf49 homolog [Tachysurus fulvidraco]
MEELIKADSEPPSTLSVFSFIPPRRNEPKERRYFNTIPKAPERHLYDCIYRRAEGYNMKLHRDDREHANRHGLDIYTEECSRPVPVLSSSEYGRRPPLPLDNLNRQFARVAHIRSEFYRKNGISKSVEEGYGSVFPI